MKPRISDKLQSIERGHYWCFVADRALVDKEKERIGKSLQSFSNDWTAHGQKVYNEYQWFGDRMILVGADLTKSDVSGCGKDALVQHMQEIGIQLKINFFDRTIVGHFTSDCTLTWYHFNDLKELIIQRRVSTDQYILNTAIAESLDLSNDLFVKIKESWMKRFVPEEAIS